MTMVQASAPSVTRLDAENPWPGLAAYDEATQAFFHGRDADASELLRLIHLAPLTVLYGNSGLGKTSLLQAGLFPRLRTDQFLPVYLRVDFSDQADAAPLEQVARRLEEEIARVGGDCPRRAADEDLWQYLHRKDLEIWSADNHLLTPVLVFDQFEELFSRSGGNRARIDAVFHGLADLIENRIPAELAGEATDRERHARLDLLAQRYRILLAFREDFLPEVETWKDKVPSLLRNRLRLLPMSHAQAIAATERAGAAVLEPGVAARIVDFVANREGGVDRGALANEPTIEPVLLSLCCTQLNRRRPPGGLIDAALLASAGQDILESFYREALAGMPERVPHFIETHLIQGDRYRGNYPRDEAIAHGALTVDELATLTDRFRLLRIDQLADTARIELIHDRLVSIVREARDARLARERELEQQRLRQVAEAEAQRERERREHAERDRARLARMRNGLLGLALLLLGAVGIAGWAAWNADRQADIAKDAENRATAATIEVDKRRKEAVEAFDQLKIAVTEISEAQLETSEALDTAKQQTSLAQDATRLAQANQKRAEASEQAARASFRQATSLRLVAEAPAMLSGSRAGGGERALLQALAAHRIMPGPAADGGLLNAVLDMRYLVKLVATGGGIGTTVAISPDGTRIVSGGLDMTLRLWDAKTGQPVGAPLRGHEGGVSSVAFNPDGTRIVSGGRDMTLRLWDAKTGQPVGAPLRGHEDLVSSVAFSPDGTRIVSVSSDKTLRLWPAPKAWPDELCAKLTRNMSRKQWREWVSPEIPYTCQCPGLPILADDLQFTAKPEVCPGKPAESLFP